MSSADLSTRDSEEEFKQMQQLGLFNPVMLNILRNNNPGDLRKYSSEINPMMNFIKQDRFSAEIKDQMKHNRKSRSVHCSNDSTELLFDSGELR